MTMPTRLRPSFAGVPWQIVSKAAAVRGFPAAAESALTAKRKPATAPSAGRSVAGPSVAYAQELPLPCQKDQ